MATAQVREMETMALSRELHEAQQTIRRHALDYGLDPFEVVFEVVDFDEMNEVAAYDGFPVRYPHWRFGMAYERLAKSYKYGLSKIYELVVNTHPAQAFLMKNNSLTDQEIVMAHVYGHSDFFKNNLWFAPTDRHMDYVFENHYERIKHYMEQYGQTAVEAFIDRVLSLENLIHYHRLYQKEDGPAKHPTPSSPLPVTVRKLKSKDYLDEFINPPEALDRERRRKEEAIEEKKRKIPSEPEQDVLLFLLQHALLELWQEDILSMLRDEMYYFVPQALTKIMNEGWAAYWHSTIMTEKILTDAEVVDYADHHAGTLSWHPGTINPYKLGMELFKNIEERWDKGRFGKEYEECEDTRKKKAWDLHLGGGRKKIFEVRRIYNDLTFLDEFLTEEFCKEHKLFVYRYNANTNEYVIDSRHFEKVKQALLFQLTNLGSPLITVEDANYKNRNELYLLHHHEGVGLDLVEAKETLKHLQTLWTRPVHLETVIEEEKKILTFDGQNLSEAPVEGG